MSCAHPIPAIDNGYKTNAKGEVVRNIKLLDMKHKFFGYGLEELKTRFGDSLILLPCGHCYSCGIDYSRMWSSRILLEAQSHLHNCFITLTYSDRFVPEQLTKKPFQDFMKRLRKEVGTVRYFACGELGESKGIRKNGNPHYHAIIFGYDFPDKELLSKSKSGSMIYRSSLLEKLWPFGISSIGEVTPESSQYVAKYSLKRKTSGINSGEFVLMSRRPGIGFCGYNSDIWRTDKLYLSGKTYKIPRYFEKIAMENNDFMYDVAKSERIARGKLIKSEKYKYNLDREEDALKRANELRIYNDALKVRF